MASVTLPRLRKRLYKAGRRPNCVTCCARKLLCLRPWCRRNSGTVTLLLYILGFFIFCAWGFAIPQRHPPHTGQLLQLYMVPNTSNDLPAPSSTRLAGMSPSLAPAAACSSARLPSLPASPPPCACPEAAAAWWMRPPAATSPPAEPDRGSGCCVELSGPRLEGSALPLKAGHCTLWVRVQALHQTRPQTCVLPHPVNREQCGASLRAAHWHRLGRSVGGGREQILHPQRRYTRRDASPAEMLHLQRDTQG